jgi:ATP-binding cassette subfamily F protein 3
VQQKIKQLERIVPIEIDEVDHSAMHLKFPPCLRSGDYPVICEGVGKSYGDHRVFSGVDLIIRRGEKVAFVGKNGEGKSTLVKCIMDEISHDGMLKVGHNVQIGYFAQNQAQLLDESLTVFQTIDLVAKGDIRLRINDILGAFMFGGEASEKKVKVLSGGERSRLAMIKLLLQPVNFLILDEPTNHLDMASKDVLKEAIRAFDGTAIIVSHDREFLDGLVSKVYEFGGGKVREHLGGIYEWIEGKDRETPQEVHSQPAPQPHREETGESLYAARKEQQKKIRKAEKAVKECEAKIAQLEQRIKEMDDLLCQPDHAADMELITEYTSTRKVLDEENDRWMVLSERLEELQG